MRVHHRLTEGSQFIQISYTRNNLVSELLMINDTTVIEDGEINVNLLVDAVSENFQYKCFEDNYTTNKQNMMTNHVQLVHDSENTSLSVDYTFGLCRIKFVESDDCISKRG